MSDFNLKSLTTITIVSIFPIIKFYKSALARPQVARDNRGGASQCTCKEYLIFYSFMYMFVYI